MNVITRHECPPRLSLRVSDALLKQQQSLDNSWTQTLSVNGSLSPNLQPPTPPILSINQKPSVELPSMFADKYILTEQIETSNLYKCIDANSSQEFCCKIVATKNYDHFLRAHLRIDGHPGINNIEEVLVGKTHTFILFSPSYGDLHSYVRSKKRLRESEAMHLFHQIATVVADCHNNGIILRDLKLRKFIFSDKEKTQIKLETLEDAVVLDDCNDDMLSDKHGCPAYVSPEILSTNKGRYSAKASDCWSLGVVLYTMLVGRYPFHDINPSVLFSKIRKGTFIIPDTLSTHAKCLIRALMRREPNERLSADDILHHRWFQSLNKYPNQSVYTTQTSLMTNSYDSKAGDQTVPDLIETDDSSQLPTIRDY